MGNPKKKTQKTCILNLVAQTNQGLYSHLCFIFVLYAFSYNQMEVYTWLLVKNKLFEQRLNVFFQH